MLIGIATFTAGAAEASYNVNVLSIQRRRDSGTGSMKFLGKSVVGW